MVSYICIYDIFNRKTYLKTLYLIPNTFKEWAENFKSLPQYCPVMRFAQQSEQQIIRAKQYVSGWVQLRPQETLPEKLSWGSSELQSKF